METLLPEQLLGPAGVAVATALILRFLIKKLLRRKFGLPAKSSEGDDPDKKELYSIWLNISAFGIGEVLAFLGVAIFVGASPENLLAAFLTGLVGAFSAVGLSEYASNFDKRV